VSNQSNFFPATLINTHLASLERKESLNETLADLVKYIEEKNTSRLFASVLLLDKTGKRLYRGAAPSLPESYSQHVDGIEIGPSAGSCGTAVFCGHSIYVCDIERDELWASFKDLALAHGLRACWSVPIMSTTDRILGTFALYYNEIKNPTLEERKFIEECARYTAILIEKAEEIRLSA
jgi:GAF domain-containing protein